MERDRVGGIPVPSRYPGTVTSCRAGLRHLLPFLVVLLLSGTAHALPFRVYLASSGKDTNPCSVDAPCRLLSVALEAVADGGEIWMQDSANYGNNVTIGKSVTILAVPGALGSVIARDGAPAVTIAASGLTVALRNLVIVNSTDSAGTHGVHMTGVSKLTIESSVIANLPGSGVYVVGAGQVAIVNSLLRHNLYGVQAAQGTAMSISGTQVIETAYTAIGVFDNANAVVTDSMISHASIGIGAETYIGTAKVTLTRSTIDHAYVALSCLRIYEQTLPSISVSYSMITNNYYVFDNRVLQNLAPIYTAGNNHIADNEFLKTNGSSGLTLVPVQ